MRYALRRWRRASGSLVVLVSVLGAAGGVASVVAAVVSTVLRNPLGAVAPETLVVLKGARLAIAEAWVPGTPILEYRHQLRGVRAVAAYGNFEAGANVRTAAGVERAQGVEVSADFFEAMGTRLTVGRAFTADEERPGRNRVVVLSATLARRAFPSGDALGATIRLNGTPFTVIGETPNGFHQPRRAEFWIPIAFGPDRIVTGTSVGFTIIGRIPAGLRFSAARAQFDAEWLRLTRLHPDSWMSRRSVDFVRASDTVPINTRSGMVLLLALSGMLWVAACVAAFDVVLGRTYARHREFAIYAALGASPRDVARHLAADAVVLTALTATSTFIGGVATLRLVGAMAPAADAVLVGGSSRTLMLVAGALLSALAGILAVAPGIFAFSHRAPDPLGAARGASNHSRWHRRPLTFALVVSQISIGFALLTGTLLLTSSLTGLKRLDPGFAARDAVSFRVSLPVARYTTPDARVALFESLVTRAARLPGVAGAAAVSALPFERPYALGTQFSVPGDTTRCAADDRDGADLTITADYFRVMGIAVIEGRSFDARDGRGAPPVVIVNAALARACWGDRSPIGQALVMHADEPPRTIVGVVADVRQFGVDQPAPFQLYQPTAQSNGLLRTVVVDSAAPQPALMSNARRLVTELDPELAVFGALTLRGHIAAATQRERFATAVTWIFTLVGLVLSSVAVYAALDREASRGAREIAIRFAVGATGQDVVRLFLRRYVPVLLGGLTLGAVWSMWMGRVMRATLPAIGPTDWALWALAATTLAICAFAGALVPTRRLVHTDPASVLRSE